MAETNLIDDVAQQIEQHFLKLKQHQWQHCPMKPKEEKAARKQLEALALSQEELKKFSKAEQRSIKKIRNHAEKQLQSLGEAQKTVVEVSEAVSEQLERLTEATYPRHDPDTPQKMYDFLQRLSSAYAVDGQQRSAGPLLEYLYTACDHAFWLWKEWIASCMALNDLTSAERLLAVLSDPQASSSQAHRFNAEGGPFKAFLIVAKGAIALKRDGDLQLAHQYADVARQHFAEYPEAVAFYRAIAQVKEGVEQGTLRLKRLAAQPISTSAQLDRLIPPNALLTGSWKTEEENQ